MRCVLAVVLGLALGSCAGPSSSAREAPPPRGTPYAEYLAGDAEAAPVIPEGTGFGQDAMILHFIDVGQGAATLVELPCGALLIDTGGERNALFDSEKVLLDYLDAFFARRTDLERTLDSLVITHPHIDHTRSIRAVLTRYRVRNVVDNGDVRQDLGGEPQLYLHEHAHAGGLGHLDIASASVGDSGLGGPIVDPIAACPRSVVDPEIRALWGARLGREEVGHDPNNDSVVLRVDYGEASALLPGDIESLAIAWLTKHYADRPELLDADVYYVPHHGSRNSTAEHLIDLVSPELAVISMGPYERTTGTDPEYTARQFGHPHRRSIGDLGRIEKGVSARRKRPIEAMVGLRGGYKDTPSEFQRRTIDRAIYATGWDGHVVVTAYPDGRLEVWTSGR